MGGKISLPEMKLFMNCGKAKRLKQESSSDFS